MSQQGSDLEVSPIERVEQRLLDGQADSQAVEFVFQLHGAGDLLQVTQEERNQARIVVQHERGLVVHHAVHEPRKRAVFRAARQDAFDRRGEILREDSLGDVAGGSRAERGQTRSLRFRGPSSTRRGRAENRF